VLFPQHSATAEAFRDFSATYGDEFSTYRGGALRWGPLDRQSVANDDTLMTTTGSQLGFAIPLHGEMYYMSHRPAMIWFYCQTPPRRAGQTTLCDGRAIWSALSASTRDELDRRRLMYRRTLGPGEWQRAFQTDDLTSVQALCTASDTRFHIDADTGVVTTEFACPGVLRRPGEPPTYINNLLFVWNAERAFGARTPPIVVRWEDGEEIPATVIDDIKAAADPLTVDINWQAGDVLLVDNTRVLHGRRDSRESGRSILVRMCEPRWAAVAATSASPR
jgi:hypothetical protein